MIIDDVIAVSSFYQFINPLIPSCPQAVVSQQLNLVLRDFFDQTQCYVYTCQRMGVKANKKEYEITDYPTGYWPERIFSIRQYTDDTDLNGTELIAGYDWTGRINPVGFTLAVPPAEDKRLVLEPKLVLLPEFNATAIPTNLFNRFYHKIACGVLAKCQAMAKTTWADAQMAIVNQGIYDDGVNNARTRAARGWTNKTIVAKAGGRFA
jgi:hypothetical protein